MRYRRPDRVPVKLAGTLGIAARQLEQRQMPGKMTMELAFAGVFRQPALDERRATPWITGFEIAVGAGMRGKGIARVALQRALDLGGAASDVAHLDPGPAEIAKEPPVVTPVRRQPFKQRQLRLV